MKLIIVNQLKGFQKAQRGCGARFADASTLVEVLMGALITAILFLSIFGVISNGTTILQSTRENLRATQILDSRMEGLRLIPWGYATNQLFDSNCVPPIFVESFYPPGLNGKSSSRGAVYYGSMAIQTNITLTPPSSYYTQMCLVTVKLNWTNTSGVHARTMSTYVAKYGLQNYVYYSTNQ